MAMFAKCKVPGCLDPHAAHFCKICGDGDSNHRSNSCPVGGGGSGGGGSGGGGLKCKVSGCTERHDRHFCKKCKNADSDHRSGACPELLHGRFLRARGRGFLGFDYEAEGEWKGDFTFVQLADTQLGMLNRDTSWGQEREQLSEAVRCSARCRRRASCISSGRQQSTLREPAFSL